MAHWICSLDSTAGNATHLQRAYSYWKAESYHHYMVRLWCALLLFAVFLFT